MSLFLNGENKRARYWIPMSTVAILFNYFSLQINGNDLREVTHHTAVNCFHDAGDTVTLLVERGAESRIRVRVGWLQLLEKGEGRGGRGGGEGRKREGGRKGKGGRGREERGGEEKMEGRSRVYL